MITLLFILILLLAIWAAIRLGGVRRVDRRTRKQAERIEAAGTTRSAADESGRARRSDESNAGSGAGFSGGGGAFGGGGASGGWDDAADGSDGDGD